MRQFLLLAFILISVSISAQAPEGINYQAAVRDNEGVVLINESVNFRTSVVQTSLNGDVIYQEEHLVTTNDFGLVNFVIGEGNALQGDFTSIPWGEDLFFARIEMDLGDGYELLGEQQLMSVPYALHAKTAETALNGPEGPQGEVGPIGPQGPPGNDGVNGVNGQDGLNGIDGEDGIDGATIITGDTAPINSIGDNGDLYLNSANNVYYQKVNGSWIEVGSLGGPIGPQGEQGEEGPQGEQGPQGVQGPQGLTGTVECPVEILPDNSGKIVVWNSTTAYGYGLNSLPSYVWVSVDIDGEILGQVSSKEKICIYSRTSLYVFGENSFPSIKWVTTSL
ncbi:MAG: collagen-like protein, partial [Flavobacteriales bacterium]|nr:collagen-like protein [Flavobacteriales bacterium]